MTDHAKEIERIEDVHNDGTDAVDKLRGKATGEYTIVDISDDAIVATRALDALRDYALALTKEYKWLKDRTDREIVRVSKIEEENKRLREEVEDPDGIRLPCEFCWTASWVPVPDDDPDGIPDPHTGGKMRCDHCWLRKQYAIVRKQESGKSSYHFMDGLGRRQHVIGTPEAIHEIGILFTQRDVTNERIRMARKDERERLRGLITPWIRREADRTCIQRGGPDDGCVFCELAAILRGEDDNPENCNPDSEISVKR